MKTKDLVLNLLMENGKTYLSGEYIADKLFITRAAVWKAIKALKEQGYTIEAVRNRGYCLIVEDERLNESKIKERMLSKLVPSDLKLDIFDEVESTNDVARSISFDDFVCDHVVVSDYQTRGRGRRGRKFFSPKGTGLYLSFLLHPNMDIAEATKLTCMSSVAVARAIEIVTGIHVDIKWVNDLYIDDRKVAGILTEAYTSMEERGLSCVIVGIGINIFPPKEGFSSELKDIATCLYETSKGPDDLKNNLCAEIINQLYLLYLNNEEDYISEYKSRSNLINHYVKIIYGGNISGNHNYGLVTGIDDECHLIVKYEDGFEEALSSGEVSVVKY